MRYEPVVRAAAGGLRAVALVGSHTAVLGFDLPEDPATRAGLLGFAVQRAELPHGTTEWLKNPCKFRHFPYAGYRVDGTDTNVAPIQQFHWIDDRLTPGHTYRYTIWTVAGTPETPTLRECVVLDITAAPSEMGGVGLYFNKGVLATPAYRSQFDNLRPDRQPPSRVAAAEAYLSRGLHEALLAFIADCDAGDTLLVAIYEFQRTSVVQALAAAVERGASVRLLYHAKGEDETCAANEAFVQELVRLSGPASDQLVVRPRTHPGRLSHNKLVVRTRAGVPDQVWTGSTNFTESGLLLQTNVGVVLRDPAVARAYAAYFELLWADPEAVRDLRAAVTALEHTSDRPKTSRLFFSPVRGDALLQTAADLIRGARDVVLLSSPFGVEVDGAIASALRAMGSESGEEQTLVYGLLNATARGKLITLDGGPNATREFVVPAWIERLNDTTYDASPGSRLKIHVKALVVDPWGEDPHVLLGSANFSGESVNDNDENMVLMTGNRWVAAVVATEFLRVLDHYRFRNRIAAIAERYDANEPAPAPMLAGDADTDVWIIAPKDVPLEPPTGDAPAVLGTVAANVWLLEDDTWQKPYYTPNDARCRARTVFAPPAPS
jgi:phosphatidylserine/phosphatidylglycerophosphate/cardiolipin synthase-like enzyme